MSLVRNFKVATSLPNQTALSWDQPLDFNNQTDEIIVTRTNNHYPMELFNTSFPDRATDPRGIEVFKGSTIVGTDTGTISVLGDTLTDTAATFPITPSLAGRILRDSTSKQFRILSNTATTITVDGTPANGKYIVLADFPESDRAQQNFELDARTIAGAGFIEDLVVISNNELVVATFNQDELANMFFRDSSGDLFIIKSNTNTRLEFFETSLTPSIGSGMTVFRKFFDSNPIPYLDTFKTDLEAAARIGTGLLDDTFYYYTAFNIPIGANVAQAEFATKDSENSTQKEGISAKDRQIGSLMYNTYWPSLYRELDETGDLEDLMEVFGFQINEIHALIVTYELQNADKVFVNALLPLSEQTGLPPVGFAIGSDTLRRIANNMIPCWKLKGSKEGIALFIKKITTWDVTNGTGDYSGSISDFLPNVEGLRFFDPNLGSLNVRITETDPFVAGGRFARTLPGIIIPGFFTFREFVITIPDVALYVGESEGFTIGSGETTLIDTANNFGAVDSLVGNFLLPNQEEVNDIFEIISNTSTSITVRGTINNRVIGGNYVVLSPLNTNRFIILNKLLPVYIPYGTRAGFDFIINP